MKHLFFEGRCAVTLLALSMLMGCCTQQNAHKDSGSVDAVLENIATRVSVRSYLPDPVPQEMVEKILRAGMAAPSAMNRQPWEFVVLTERATLDTLAKKLVRAPMLQKAPMAIVVCAYTGYIDNDGKFQPNPFWVMDASAVSENILLAAHALGLGAVWTNAYDQERGTIVHEALGMPAEYWPLCVIPVGFPDSENTPKDKWKPKKIHYQKW